MLAHITVFSCGFLCFWCPVLTRWVPPRGCHQCKAKQNPEVRQERKQEEERQAEERRKEKVEEREAKERHREEEERRQVEDLREEERDRVEAETTETHEASARQAPLHACDSFDSLRSIGGAYHFVCGQRLRRQGLEAPLKAFERLMMLLQEGRDRRDVNDVRQYAGTMRSAAGTGERVAAMLREALWAGQQEIQHLVAASVQSWDKSHIEPIWQFHELPEQLQQKRKNRDLLRTRHAQELRLALQDLLQAGRQPCQYIVEEPADITSWSGLEQVARLLEARDRDFESALAAACLGLKEYNTQPQIRVGADAVK